MREPYILALGLLLTHCAATPAPAPADPKSEEALKVQVKRRNALQAELEQVPAPSRQRCELLAGDCRMDVSEGRHRLLRDHRTAQCSAATDSDAELECVSVDLAANGQASLANEYYRLENWCLEKLVACTAKLADDAVASAQQAALQNRKDRIEVSRAAISARALVPYASERVAYLRALLPVPGDSLCSDQSARVDCEKSAHMTEEQFQAELAKDDASYDELEAIALYEASHAALAECRTPEAECLTAKLDDYGGNAETRRYLADTLKSLSRRQELLVEAGEEASTACLNAFVQQHQARIVEDYRRFAREPVLFFQAQLHRDFRVLYEAQIGCLQATVHPGGKSGNTRNAARPSTGSREPG